MKIKYKTRHQQAFIYNFVCTGKLCDRWEFHYVKRFSKVKVDMYPLYMNMYILDCKKQAVQYSDNLPFKVSLAIVLGTLYGFFYAKPHGKKACKISSH